MELFDLNYFIPYEGENTLTDLTIEEVHIWLGENYDESESAVITPSDVIKYDKYSFRVKYPEVKKVI